jgi:hypothetical protein
MWLLVLYMLSTCWLLDVNCLLATQVIKYDFFFQVFHAYLPLVTCDYFNSKCYLNYVYCIHLLPIWCCSSTTWPSWKGLFCVCKCLMLTCYFLLLLVAMVLLAVILKLGATWNMYVVYLLATWCWSSTRCPRAKVWFWDTKYCVPTCYLL